MTPQVYNSEERLTQTLEETKLLEQYDQLGGANYEGIVRSTLLAVGFAVRQDFTLPVEVLSGGQKKLLSLAKILITKPAVLLLDEPDNDLDLAGKALSNA